MKLDVVIAAAGNSLRMGRDKLLLPIGDDTLLCRTLSVFVAHPNVERVVVVLKEEDGDLPGMLRARFPEANLYFVRGGESRAQSVLHGVQQCTAPFVAVHDGARPFVQGALLDRLIACAAANGSAVPALPLHDSVRSVRGDAIMATADRDALRCVQTPQIFPRTALLRALAAHPLAADEAEAMVLSGHPVRWTEGDVRNIKVTDMGSYFGLNARVGAGFDIHRLVVGRTLVVGGIALDYERGAWAHSDGDVLCHALIDALFSAAGQRDIGHHYPDDDERYRDVDSTLLLADAMDQLRACNFRVSSVSATVFLQRPKINDFIPLMQLKLAHVMGVEPAQIAIAAKTGEGLDSVGKGEAIAASVVVTLT